MKLPLIAILTIGSVTRALRIRDSTNGTLPSSYTWNVTNWQCGLNHGNPSAPPGGWYAFTVSGADAPSENETISAFSAYCQGSASGSPLTSEFVDCALDLASSEFRVMARIYATGDNTQCHVAISHLTGGRNTTGYTTKDWARERAPYNFTITDIENT